MADYLMREDAPFGEEVWAKLDDLTVKAARQILVGRKFIELIGPFGYGFQAIPAAGVLAAGDDGEIVEPPAQLPVLTVQKDFWLSAQPIETSKKFGLPLELGAAAAAAAFVARKEDELIFFGHGQSKGLLKAAGLSVPLAGWEEAGSALQNVADAREALVKEGAYGPYAAILSPALYGKLTRFVSGGRLELSLVKDVAEGGVFQTPILGEKQGLVVSLGPQNFDLAVGQDLITAYLGPEGMSHRFRVLESLALRIKRPEAICVLK